MLGVEREWEAGQLPKVLFYERPYFKREQHGEILSNITKIVEVGNLKPLLDEQQFSLDNVGEAYTRLESKKAIGKVVVEN